MTNQAEVTRTNHRRAVRFFWGLLIGATLVSLIGNITHAVLVYIPQVVIEIGAVTVPPIALLAAVHGIALAVRAGASGRIYRWAVSAVAAIGVGAFAVSFLALRDLMQVIGYSSATVWIFPVLHRHNTDQLVPE
jgi:Na+/H+-dicarboxylate symporter